MFCDCGDIHVTLTRKNGTMYSNSAVRLKQGWRTCGPRAAKDFRAAREAFRRDQQSWTNRFHSM